MANKFILIDTCFLIYLLNGDSPYHEETVKYFQNFAAQDYLFYVSTIAIGEYCVKDDEQNIPFQFLLPLPYNFEHSVLAGEFQRFLLCENRVKEIARNIIKNDVVMLAQANYETNIEIFLTADTNARKMYSKIQEHKNLNFKFVSIHEQTASQYFNVLDLE